MSVHSSAPPLTTRLVGDSSVGRSARTGRAGAASAVGGSGSRGGSGRGAGALHAIPAIAASADSESRSTGLLYTARHDPAVHGSTMTPPAERIVLSLPRGAFHALAWGEPAAPPLLWLHGFPDHPPTAAPFLARLARTRRVIAPWLRGYAPSPLEGPYDLDTLAADAAAILERIAGEGGRADVIGHDWGALIAYRVCAVAP